MTLEQPSGDAHTMPRPEVPVVRDSRSGLWAAVRDGVVCSSDLSPSMRLRASFSATGLQPLRPLVNDDDWRAHSDRLRAGLPYASQRPPTPLVPPSPPPPPPCDGGGGGDDENVAINTLRSELRRVEAECERGRKRERALFKVVEGLCELHATPQ